MTINTSTTAGRIISGIVVAVVMILVAAVLASQSDISALKVRVQNVEKAIEDNKATLESVRKENREDHNRIGDQQSRIGDQLQELLRRK